MDNLEACNEEDEYDTDLEADGLNNSLCRATTRLESHGVGVDTYTAVCQSLHVRPIKLVHDQLWGHDLDLYACGLEPAHAQALAVALLNNQYVESIDLEGNRLGGEGAAVLLRAIRHDTFITRLNLASNSIGRRGATAVGELLVLNTGLQELDLSDNSLTDGDAPYLAYGLQSNCHIRRLILSGNMFSVSGLKHLGKAVGENQSLRYLDLSWNHIRGTGAVWICKGLQANCSIASVNLGWNGLAFEGAMALKQLLSRNNILKHLDVTNNRIHWEAVRFIADGLMQNRTLEVLKIGQNPISMDGCFKILQAVAKPNSSIRYVSFEAIPVDSRVAFKAEDIARSRNFRIVHGGVVSTKDFFLGMPVDSTTKSAKSEDPVILLLRYLSRKGIRVVELFRTFDTRNQDDVSRENFIRGLKRIQAPLDDEGIEDVIRHFRKPTGSITYKVLAQAVRKRRRDESIEERRIEHQEQARIEGRRRIMAPELPRLLSPVLPHYTSSFHMFSPQAMGKSYTMLSAILNPELPTAELNKLSVEGQDGFVSIAKQEGLPAIASTSSIYSTRCSSTLKLQHDMPLSNRSEQPIGGKRKVKRKKRKKPKLVLSRSMD